MRLKIFIYIKYSLGILAFSFLLESCKKDSSQLQFEIGNDLIDVESKISICDTFSIEMSTVQSDSIVTSGGDNMLIGTIKDSRLGKLNSQCYYRLSVPSTIPFIDGDVYDSISMIVKLNGYSCGDTTIKQNWNVYRLNQDLETNDNGYLYSSSSFAHYNEILGNMYFKAYPSMNQEVKITLNQSFGKNLFDLYMDGDDKVKNLANFHEFIKGFTIQASGISMNTMLGVNINDSSIFMRIYGHRVNEEKTNLKMDFIIETGSLPFSEITHDRSNTMLEGLISQKLPIPSSLTNNEAYVQGGTGLMMRVDIPGLAKVLEIEHAVLMKAELILKPVLGSYQKSQLPTKIVYSKCDKNNKEVTTYSNPTTNERIYGSLSIDDELYNENTYYSVDITPCISDELSDNSFIAGKSALLLSYNDPTFNSTTSSIVFGNINNKNQKAILRLYFLHY